MSMAALPPLVETPALLIIVMGVSGCGKSSVGERLAAELGCRFVEGDSLHPPMNIAKMSAGIALQDGDRWPWLDVIGDMLAHSSAQRQPIVIACSALKKAYRDRLRDAAGGGLAFVFLEGTRAVLEARMAHRAGHFMPASLLDSQFSTLEPPNGENAVVTVDVSLTLDAIVAEALAGLRALSSAELAFYR